MSKETFGKNITCQHIPSYYITKCNYTDSSVQHTYSTYFILVQYLSYTTLVFIVLGRFTVCCRRSLVSQVHSRRRLKKVQLPHQVLHLLFLRVQLPLQQRSWARPGAVDHTVHVLPHVEYYNILAGYRGSC
jgi:DNA-directed RNA polymerase subunit N (RpoN/RPB10)